MRHATARGGRAPLAGLGVVLAVLVSILVYLGWQRGLTLGDIPGILAQTPLWFYVAIAGVVLSAMVVALRGSQQREAAAAKPIPKTLARGPRPVRRPTPAEPKVIVEFVPVGPTIVAEHTEPPFGLPSAEPAAVAEIAPEPAPEPMPVPEPEPTPEPARGPVPEPGKAVEPEVAPEPVVDLGPELALDAPEERRAAPPKPEVALQVLEGWLAETSPEAVAPPTAPLRRKRDEPTA